MKQTFKRLQIGTLAILSLLSMAIAIFPIHVPKAEAAGETYTWKNYNTITVSGGNFKSPVDYKLVQGSNPQRFMTDFNPVIKPGCNLALTITLTSDTSATLSAPLPIPNPPVSASPVGYSGCDEWYPKKNRPLYPGVSASYNGQTVTIGGTRGPDANQTETDLQKEVVVVVNSPNPNSQSPNTIGMTIKDSAGKVVATANPAKEASLGSTTPGTWNYVDPTQQPVYYLGDFHLDPGNYLVCADIVIADCRKFTKVKFQSLNLQYGDDSTQRTLEVVVHTTYIGGVRDLTVGPYTVTVQKPGGAINSQQTDTQTHKMTPDEKAVQGGVMATYQFWDRTVFNGLDPATYQVCVDGVQDCKDVVKSAGQPATVTFEVDYNAFSTDNSKETDCQQKYTVMGIKAVTFLICSVIDTASYAVGGLDSAISGLLTVNTSDIFSGTASGNAYHTAWNSFRVFALGLLVIAALIMLVSQAADVEIVSAYTIRKVLPRILISVVLISLSWNLLELLCNLSNDAGNGLRELIYMPFKDLPNGGEIGGGSLFVLTLIGTGGALALGWIGLLSFVVTGLIASLTGAAVLIIRKMLLMIVIIMAPFAIAASVLPNTRKVYDVWKETLIATLVVFPIITMFIAIGRVFSVFAFNAPGNQTINQIIAVIAYFGPYFLITRSFKMAGGLVARVGGMADRQAQSLSGRVKKYRSNKIDENMGKMAAGQRFQGNNPFARAFNSTTFGAATYAKSPAKVGFLTNKNVRKAAMAQQRAINTMHYKDQPWFKALAHNDKALRAQTYASAAEARANMAADFAMSEADVEAGIAAAKANGGFGRNQQLAAVNQLFATGTGYDNLPQALNSITRVAGNNTEMAMGIIGEGNFTSGEVGRADLKVSFGKYAELWSKQASGGQVTADDIDDAYLQSALENESLSMLRGKPRVAQNMMPALERQLIKARDRAGDTKLDPKDRAAAQELSGRISGIMEQYQQNANMYSSPIITEHVENTATKPNVVNLREDVQSEASPVMLSRDRNGNLVPTGTINNRQNQNTARGYNQTRPKRPGQ